MIAGILAIGLLVLVLSVATKKIEDLSYIQNNNRIIMLFATMLISGIIVAVLSTYRAVSKYLKLSLDELY
jgi:cell division transport system permease protein